MIGFLCGVCRKELETPDEQAGKLVRCPHCMSTLRVPPLSVGSNSIGGLTPPDEFNHPSPSPSGPNHPTSYATGDTPPPPARHPTLEESLTDESRSNAPSHDVVPAAPHSASRSASPNPSRLPLPRPQAQGGRRYGFNCPYCSSRLEAVESMASQHGSCPTCGNEIVIPILDRYGRLIDPLTGKVLKQDPHPVHAYAAAGERAPMIVRRTDGSQAIRCPRCPTVSPISANNCVACGMPFTMEGTTVEAAGSTNGMAVASLVLGILGIPSACTFIIPLLGVIFGIVALVQIKGTTGGAGRGMAIAGIICGGLGLLLAVAMIFT